MNEIPMEVSIQPAVNGYIVRVGCKVIVIQDTDVLLRELKNYFAFPAETYSDWQARFPRWFPEAQLQPSRECYDSPRVNAPPLRGFEYAAAQARCVAPKEQIPDEGLIERSRV